MAEKVRCSIVRESFAEYLVAPLLVLAYARKKKVSLMRGVTVTFKPSFAGKTVLVVLSIVSAIAQTSVLTVDSNGNLTASASLSAKAGVGGGTYTSGISATTSTSGGTCSLTFTGGGGTNATATVAVSSSGSVGSTLSIGSTGYGYTSAPSQAYITMASNGSGPTCTLARERNVR